MEKKRALLAVVGGRRTPDVLALFYVRPHVVVILTSEEGWKGTDESIFIERATSLPNHEHVLPTVRVKSYAFEEIRQACINACESYPQTEWDWTFSIGSCPKIMGIAAYEVAKQMQIPCIYIDTQHESIISLVRDRGISSDEFFHMKVADYMKIYQREPEVYGPREKEYRETVQEWSHIARIMALSPDTPSFTKLMHHKTPRAKVTLFPETLVTSPLIQELEACGAIKTEQKPGGATTCEFTSRNFARFLGTGDWLEIYVWHEVKEAGFADDYQWGYPIKSTANNEIDVVLTYRAQLIFAECKTDENPFQEKTHYLDTINSKAEMLGSNYVTKIFVTNAPKTQPGYANFWEQAKLRKIVVATAEDLPHIRFLFKKQAESPDDPRI